jgi:hypothetical protein
MKKTILLQEIATDPSRSVTERQLASEALSDAPPAIVEDFLTDRAANHLLETTEQDLQTFIDARDLKHQQPLDFESLIKEFGFWHLPSAKALECLGFSEARYWKLVIEQSKSNAVRANARKKLRELKEEA